MALRECDRCGRETKFTYALIDATIREKGSEDRRPFVTCSACKDELKIQSDRRIKNIVTESNPKPPKRRPQQKREVEVID